MFKGLRTKIESEQKGDKGQSKDDSSTRLHQNIVSNNTSVISVPEQQQKFENKNAKNKIDSTKESSSEITGSESIILDKKIEADENLPDITRVIQNNSLQEEITRTANKTQKYPFNKEPSQRSHDLVEEITDLRNEVSRLHDQLKSVMKERDESNDQNAQLYQLIEKLRRDLESDKETIASLQGKLDKIQKETTNNKGGASGSISIKSFDLFNNNDDKSNELENLENCKRKINEFQSQLIDKNRQLKIKQQNLNDIKRALQKEMVEHNKTQNELNKLKKQLQNTSQSNELNECQSLQNGSTHSDNDLDSKNDFNPSSSDKQHQQQSNPEIISQLSSYNNNRLNNDEINVNLEMGTGSATSQLDKISYLSRSSASVDEFDTNDLQQNSCSIGVNHEYLRNVLYRYMTSTDTETARHLVKALTVLMNFTPEQSAAIKSAMNSRSSWLRLR